MRNPLSTVHYIVFYLHVAVVCRMEKQNDFREVWRKMGATDARVKEFLKRYGETATVGTACRFLAAREGNAEKACAMYDRHLEWRKTAMPIANSSDVLAQLRTGKVSLQGRDINNCPVILWYGTKHVVDKEKTDAAIAAITHVCLCARRRAGDFGKVTIAVFAPGGSPFDKDFIRKLASVLQDNFPESLHKLLLWPCGTFTYVLWSVAKWFLDARTREKVVMIRGSRKAVLEEGKLVPYLGKKHPLSSSRWDVWDLSDGDSKFLGKEASFFWGKGASVDARNTAASVSTKRRGSSFDDAEKTEVGGDCKNSSAQGD
eukprot:g552.t1